MDTTLLFKNIARFIPLRPEAEQFLTSVLRERKLKRKQFLYHEGEIATYTAFVNKGLLRSYSIDKNGEEHILQFAPEDWWITDMHSVISNQPGLLNIDAIEESELLLLSTYDREKLLHDFPEFERFFRLLVEKALVTHQQRLLDNISLTAAEKYDKFSKKYPQLIQRVPGVQIASYLGMTPEFLSKIRKNAAKA